MSDKKRKMLVRIICLVLAGLMVLGCLTVVITYLAF